MRGSFYYGGLFLKLYVSVMTMQSCRHRLRSHNNAKAPTKPGGAFITGTIL